jgi:hypothetical protein
MESLPLVTNEAETLKTYEDCCERMRAPTAGRREGDTKDRLEKTGSMTFTARDANGSEKMFRLHFFRLRSYSQWHKRETVVYRYGLAFADLLWLHRNDSKPLRALWQKHVKCDVALTGSSRAPIGFVECYGSGRLDLCARALPSLESRARALVVLKESPIDWRVKGTVAVASKDRGRRSSCQRRKVKTRAIESARVRRLSLDLLEDVLQRLATWSLGKAAALRTLAGIRTATEKAVTPQIDIPPEGIALDALVKQLLAHDWTAWLQKNRNYRGMHAHLHRVSGPLTRGRQDRLKHFPPVTLVRLTHDECFPHYPFYALRRVHLLQFDPTRDLTTLLDMLDDAYREQKVAKRYRHLVGTARHGRHKDPERKPAQNHSKALKHVCGTDYHYSVGNRKEWYGNGYDWNMGVGSRRRHKQKKQIRDRLRNHDIESDRAPQETAGRHRPRATGIDGARPSHRLFLSLKPSKASAAVSAAKTQGKKAWKLF